MSDNAITDSAGIDGPVTEKTVPRKRTAASTATKKVAEEAPQVQNVVIEEMDNNSINEDGQKVIIGPKKTRGARNSNSFVTETGAIGSRAADRALQSNINTEAPQKDGSTKVALWSRKNIRWGAVGTLSKGYNIVTKEAAELWLTKEGIREATPEEVATHYGK